MSSQKLFDVHTHVQFTAYDEDREAVIWRALESGVWMVNVGTQRDTSAAAIECAKKYSEGVYATVGLHPIHTDESHYDVKELGNFETAQGFTSRKEEFDYEFYKTLSANLKVVAIGECGLDYYRVKSEELRKKQKEVFIRHIELAHEVKKPLMIHCRNAFDDLNEVLKDHRDTLKTSPGIIHFFSGTIDDAKKLLDIGFLFSFGGVITFAHDYDDQVKYIPLDRILLETDAPYVAPPPYRGKRNEPAFITETAKKMAEIKSDNYDKIVEVTTSNARKVFKI